MYVVRTKLCGWNVDANRKPRRKPYARTWGHLIIQQKVPIDCRFRSFLDASKHAFQNLYLAILRSAGLDVPHAEGDAATRGNDDIVF
jgi:hypothetical protein